jgi:putative peptidoglycan lipid II flippase
VTQIPESHAPGVASRRYAFLVAAGIFLSRISGLVRDRIFAHYFGLSATADAFKAALRIPNVLQNLFGEGVLSASFIPIYASLLARDDDEEARRTAGAIAALLLLATSVLVLIGVLGAPWITYALAAGFSPEKRDLTVRIVRILFPGVGLLVLSAWCLGILNSHRRFFLSYSVGVLWNAGMIAAMLGWGNRSAQDRLAIILAWGSVAGSALQVGVQLPVVLRLLGGLRLSLGRHSENVKTVVVNFFPVFISRGVVQISAYVDGLIASWLPTAAVSGLANAQLLYTLPVSLFGMSVSAAELPQMSGAVGEESQVADILRGRLNAGLRQIAYLVVPSVAGFLVLGDVIVGAIYRTGRFGQADVTYVWGILAGATVGLLASTLARLYASTYYALRDTRTPLRFAIVRVVLTSLLGYLCALPLPRYLGIEARWGVAGLTISAGVAAWVEFHLLRSTMNRRIGRTGLPADYLAKLWATALLGAASGWVMKYFGGNHISGNHREIVLAVFVLGLYGVIYFAGTWILGIPEARALFSRFLKASRPAT